MGILFAVPVVFIAVAAPFLCPYDPLDQNMRLRLNPPSSEYLLGTDAFGRDVLSRIFLGARYSIVIAATSIGVALLVGSIIGGISAYYGGKFDVFIVAAVDFLMTFPALILAMLITSVLNPSIPATTSAICIAFIPRFIRLIRATVLVIKEEVFVIASRSLGQKEWKILLFHVLPNSLSTAITMGLLWISSALLAESSLSFLGLGVQPPTPSWGSMVREGLDHITGHPFLLLVPSIAISIAILGFNLIGDRLQEFFNPKLRSRF
jgi:peptide/nickel transport system permease protein